MAAGKDEMVEGDDTLFIDWIWRFCNMAFESGVVSEDWRSAVIAPLYKDKGERTKCKNYKDISLLSVVKKNISTNISGQDRRTRGFQIREWK